MRRPLPRAAPGRGAWIVCALALGACDSDESAAAVLEPGAADRGAPRARRVDVGALAVPAVEAARRAVDAPHRLRAVVRSAEGVAAYGARVELWRYPSRADEPELVATGRTRLDGVALLPFDGHGAYCVRAVHPDVGAASSAPSTYRLRGRGTTVDATVVLPPGEAPLARAGVAQVGVADAQGRPLAGADVHVWRHDYAADETTLAASGCTDTGGVVRLVLDRPDWYAVVATHPERGTSATDYAWFEPRPPRGERAPFAAGEGRRPVRCDAHLVVGDAPKHAAEPRAFLPRSLAEDAPDRAVLPTCCRAWTVRAPERIPSERSLLLTEGAHDLGARSEAPFLLRSTRGER